MFGIPRGSAIRRPPPFGIAIYHTVEFEGLIASTFEGYVTKFAPHKALQLITGVNFIAPKVLNFNPFYIGLGSTHRASQIPSGRVFMINTRAQ